MTPDDLMWLPARFTPHALPWRGWRSTIWKRWSDCTLILQAVDGRLIA